MNCEIWTGRNREGLPIKGNKSVHHQVSGLEPVDGTYYITTCGNSLCVEKSHIILFDGYDIPMVRPIVRKMFDDGKEIGEISKFIGIGERAVKNIIIR